MYDWCQSERGRFSMSLGLRSDDDRLKNRTENRRIEIQRKHTDNVNALKERFQREERQLVEIAERDRKNESEASLDTLRHMREVEDKQTRCTAVKPLSSICN